MKIVLPELKHIIIKEALAQLPEIEAIEAEDLKDACNKVNSGEADALVAGIEYTSREVILACKEIIGMESPTFSSSFILTRSGQTYILADAATCKNPTEQQLYDIVVQTYTTAKIILKDTPKVAMLSFSTLGSGGSDQSIDRICNVVREIRAEHPDILIDGELQLDAAIDSAIGNKKAPTSVVAGRANILICPDINSGNILYKSIEQFGGFTAAGPILQGFKKPVSDLSRGSTVADVVAVIKVMQKLVDNG